MKRTTLIAYLLVFSFSLLKATAQTSFGGIGVRIARDSVATGWWPYISDIIEGGPASDSKIWAWQWIRSVNGVSTNNLSTADVSKMIAGAEGTKVVLQIGSAEAPQTFELIRRRVVNTDLVSVTIPSLIPYRSGAVWGYVNRDKKVILPLKYTRAWSFINGYAVVTQNYKSGLIDTLGREIIPLKYSWMGQPTEGMVAFEEGGLYGCMDVKGKLIAAAKYKSAPAFVNGYAKVKGTNGYYGFIDKSGKEVVPFKYDEASDFYNGIAVVSLNKKCGFINTAGNEVTPLKYNAAYSLPKLSNGMYAVQQGTLYGYVDYAGREVIAPQYASANDFKNGVAGVMQNDQWFFINKDGKAFSNARFADVGKAYANGLAPVQNSNDLYGYAAIDGQIRIPYTYKYASPFVGSAAYATTDFRAYVIIGGSGKNVVSDTYEEVKMFTNGVAILKKNRKWAYANANNLFKTITPFKYDYAYEFNNGLAWVNFNGGEGYYIDGRGTEYVDTSTEKNAKEAAEKDKYVNHTEKLNKAPSDGSATLKRDDVYSAYLSKGDDTAYLSNDGKWRYIDQYKLTLKKGDRLRLSASSTDFFVIGFVKSPSGVENLYYGKQGTYITILNIDTVVKEDGDHYFFITSGEGEATGMYSASKSIASAPALSLPATADFCTRLQYIVRHGKLHFDFMEGALVSDDNTGILDRKVWSTDIQLEKDKKGTLQTAALGRAYHTTIYTATSLASADAAFKKYEQRLRACLTGYDFKLKEDPSATDGPLKSLEAVEGFSDGVTLSLEKDAGGYAIKVVVK